VSASASTLRLVSDNAARAYLDDLGKMRELASAAHDIFIESGCSSYVKTIYVGYDIAGEMVAALYGHADHVEVALALPEDADGSLLVDASHLTWRTLPVAAILRDAGDLDQFRQLASLAASRIRSDAHSVLRDNDFFIRSKRDRGARGEAS
jgi:hypothetical protein